MGTVRGAASRTSRTHRHARAVLIAILLVALGVSPASAQDRMPTFSTVIVVLAPYLTWQHVADGTVPSIARMAPDSALGCLSVRAGAIETAPSALRGAAILSAGRPVDVSDALSLASNEVVGTLGEAVRAAGGMTVAIGTSALLPAGALDPYASHAYAVALDREGAVSRAETSPRILRTDADTGEFVSDIDVLEAVYRSALASATADPATPALIVIDPGDPVRAREMVSTDAAREASEVRAAHATDEVVRVALRSLPVDAALVIVSTAQYASSGAPGFGPLVVYGAGPGTVVSESTHREIISTLPDVSATILALLGIEVPEGVTGLPLLLGGADGGTPDSLAEVLHADREARALEALRVPVWTGTIALAVLGLGVAIALVLGGVPGRAPGARVVVSYALVAVCGAPVATLVARALGYASTARDAWLRFAIALILVLGAAAWRARRTGARRMLGTIAWLTVAVVCADQLLGGPAAYGSAFSYSALFGTRFFGLGNEGAAIAVGAALLAAGMRLDRADGGRARDQLVLGSIVVIVAVLPIFGANFGVAAWGTAAFLTAYLYSAGKRLDVKVAAGAVAAAALVLGAAAVLDAIAPGVSHFGRVLTGQTDLAALIQRKLALNLSILTATPVVVLLPLALAAIAYVLARPTGRVGDAVLRSRGIAAAVAGGVAAALVGMITEDSGVVVSALVMMFPAIALAVAALETREETA